MQKIENIPQILRDVPPLQAYVAAGPQHNLPPEGVPFELSSIDKLGPNLYQVWFRTKVENNGGLRWVASEYVLVGKDLWAAYKCLSDVVDSLRRSPVNTRIPSVNLSAAMRVLHEGLQPIRTIKPKLY